MNKTLKTLFVPAVLAGVLSLPTLAHASKITDINARQAKQGARINAGVRSGELTPKEAAYLRNKAAQIRAQEAKDRSSGGKFTDAEKKDIQNQLDALSREIDTLRYNKDRTTPTRR